MNTTTILEEFKEKVDQIFGLYNDAIQGFGHNLRTVEKGQKHASTEMNLTIEHLDTIQFAYGEGHPADPSTEILHITTQGEYKTRNKEGGRNSMLLGNLCITQIYDDWEDHYRKELANQKGVTKDDIKSPLFGELRHYRRSITHNRAIAIKELDGNKILKWFKEGDVINLNKTQVKELISCIKEEVVRLKIVI